MAGKQAWLYAGSCKTLMFIYQNRRLKKMKDSKKNYTPLDIYERWMIRTILVFFLLIVALAELILYFLYLNPRITSGAERDYYFFSRVIEEDPENIQAYLALAEAYYKMKKYDKAISVLEEAEKISALDFRPIFEKGRIFYELGKKTESKVEFEKALKISPGSFLPAYYMGKIYFESKRYPVAAFYFRKALEIDSTSGDAHYMLGATYEKMGLHLAAMDEYRETLKYLPDDRRAQKALKRLGKDDNDK